MRMLAVSVVVFMMAEGPLHAASLGASSAAIAPGAVTAQDVVEVVGRRGGMAVRRSGAVRGPRGNVAVGRTTAVVRPGYRGGGVRRPLPPPGPRPGWHGPWVRPTGYWWVPGTAIAAGAAVGFVTAETAAAWAGAPPAPNMCWYYTNAAKTQGFWDTCP